MLPQHLDHEPRVAELAEIARRSVNGGDRHVDGREAGARRANDEVRLEFIPVPFGVHVLEHFASDSAITRLAVAHGPAGDQPRRRRRKKIRDPAVTRHLLARKIPRADGDVSIRRAPLRIDGANAGSCWPSESIVRTARQSVSSAAQSRAAAPRPCRDSPNSIVWSQRYRSSAPVPSVEPSLTPITTASFSDSRSPFTTGASVFSALNAGTMTRTGSIILLPLLHPVPRGWL